MTAMASKGQIPDGLTTIDHALPAIMELIAETARWVHPDVFRALPVWYPEAARKAALYKANWSDPQLNKGLQKYEGNVAAQKALFAALGVPTTKKPANWTTCHIWGYDDQSFQGGSVVVQDRRFFSCVGNMVLLPTPLKGFTDAVPIIKRHLRVGAYHLYGWACEHEVMANEAEIVRSGEIPTGYPASWPTSERKILPPGTGPNGREVIARIEKRKREISRALKDGALTHYPKSEVEAVLKFWKVDLQVDRDGR